jgi:Skp family chaperone for outer membrane proteins
MGSCSAITQAGERCRSIAITGSDYCHAHHPDRAEARKKAARHGGKRGGRGRPQVELNDIKERIVALADAVENGDLRAITVELQITEQLELVERLEALEQQLEQRRSRAWG